MTMTTIKGRDLKASETQAVKIGGRWYWIVGRSDTELTNGGFVLTVPVARDPRLPSYQKLRYVYHTDDFKVRPQTPPVWEWVTRKLAAI